MRRVAKLEWQINRQPGTVGSAQLQQTQRVCMLYWGADEVDAKLVVGRLGEGWT